MAKEKAPAKSKAPVEKDVDVVETDEEVEGADNERITEDSGKSDEDESDEEDAEDAPPEKAAAKPRVARKAPAKLAPVEEEDEVETDEKPVDYLRQYQYKKVNDKPSIGHELGDRAYLTDPDKGSKAEKMKAHLLSQPRVRVLVPRAPGEHPSVLMTVNLNGYRLDFPKNAYVEMPEQIADIIMQSQKQTATALQTSRIDSDKEKQTALL